MNSIEIELILKLRKDPAVLFIGQKHLKLDNSADLFLSAILKKYSVESPNPTYYDLWKISEQKESICAWGQKLSESISVPESLKTIAQFPWNHVYTSAVDDIIVRAFRSELRTVQPVFGQQYKLSNPRSRTQLHQTYLFGQIQYTDYERVIPFSKFDLQGKVLNRNVLLNRLPGEIVTPRGTLIIEGWDSETDWLKAEDFYAVLSKFGDSQIHVFSCIDSISKNEYILDLEKKGKLISHKKSLASFLSEAQNEGLFNVSEIFEENEGLWLTIGEKRIRVPDELKKQISPAAIIIHNNLFEYNHYIRKEELPSEFKYFISYSTTIPKWEGYGKDLDFKRNFIDKALEFTLNSIKQATHDEKLLLIIHGQASSGKTIGLGRIAYELIKNNKLKVAVLFIERSYKRIDENDIRNIDAFSVWAENQGAEKTIILYDGMLTVDVYYDTLNNLRSRGRKIILIGTSYALKKQVTKHQIEVPIELTNEEKNRFVSYIKPLVPDKPTLDYMLKNLAEKNFLSILYHYLPSSKGNINQLVRNEAKNVVDQIHAARQDNSSSSGIMKELLLELGFEPSIENDSTNDEILFDNTFASLANRFVNIVMAIGQLGYSIPFEIVVRALGETSLQASFFKNIPQTDLLRWYEDHNGNISIGPRTTLEAKICAYSLGGLHSEVDYIKIVLENIRDASISTQEDIEIEFASILLRRLKEEESPYRRFAYDFAEVLRSLRESGLARNPRLVLQEAGLIQNAVKEKGLPESVKAIDALDRAEEILRETLEDMNRQRISSPTQTYLQVELASIIGSKGKQMEYASPDMAIKFFREARAEILKSSLSTENYHSFDVLLWTIHDQANLTVDNIERLKLLAESEHYIHLIEEEGVSVAQEEKFLGRKQILGQVFKDDKLSEDAFNKLKASGSALGYYLRAKERLGKVDLLKNEFSETDISNIKSAYDYLINNIDLIKNDGKSLYLIIKLWWLLKVRHRIFYKERLTLPLTTVDWDKLLGMVNLLLSSSDQYLFPSLYYLRALSQFHLQDFNGALDTFRQLSELTHGSSLGQKRIRKYYVASNENGTEKLFHGIVEDIDPNKNSGYLLVDGLNKKVRFFYNDFRKKFSKGDALEFHIAFNFISPVAIPVRY